ncbi:MAG: ADP-ribosylglycohydrolase family protein [Spirochaetaceae bacterium]|nr:MAG: ADP-ribosylglycohydrolase family protein [Spirochaetaceae bacterium]
MIGDALAMPAHWYYNREALQAQFGVIDRFVDPPRHHPDSILWRSQYAPTEPEFDILGEQRAYWGQRGVHYHQFLRAGENTLNVQLVQRVLRLVAQRGGYDREAWIDEYLRFMRNPAGHRDTYVEECHRGFFLNLRRGRPPERCAVVEKHIGGMVPVIPLYATLRSLGHGHPEAAAAVQSHVAVTHGGAQVETAASDLLVMAGELWDGISLTECLLDHVRRQDLEFLSGPIERLATLPPGEVLGRHFSTACYLDESMPATAYLALRYAADPREALIHNTMAGGDNCGRGAVLGALCGVALGPDAFPPVWRDGLCPGVPAQSMGSESKPKA